MKVRIGDRSVGAGHPCFVVAEIGINHNGDVNLAKKLIDIARGAGCDAVKFQKRDIELCYTQEELATPRESPWGKTNGEQKRGLEFNQEAYVEIDRHCREVGMMWTASPWDEPSVDFLEQFNPPFYKIPSARVRGEDEFLRYVRSKGRPVVMSTGACDEDAIRHAVNIVGEENLVLMHCVLTYPAAEGTLNLRMIETLKSWFPNVPIGYSGHEVGLPTSVMAAVLGAAMVERHITTSRAIYGSDQAASMEPAGITTLVRDIRMWERERGDGQKTVLPGELANFEKLRRKGKLYA
jgi:N-acetylneuraminate synthase